MPEQYTADQMIAAQEKALEQGDRTTILTFDWVKAAALLRKLRPKDAIAGLLEDWSWTSGTIIENHRPINPWGGCYFRSFWATPGLVMDGGEDIPCYNVGDAAHERAWSPLALAIFKGAVTETLQKTKNPTRSRSLATRRQIHRYYPPRPSRPAPGLVEEGL